MLVVVVVVLLTMTVAVVVVDVMEECCSTSSVRLLCANCSVPCRKEDGQAGHCIIGSTRENVNRLLSSPGGASYGIEQRG